MGLDLDDCALDDGDDDDFGEKNSF